MTHYADDELHDYESDPEHHPARDLIRAHLASCESCRLAHEHIREIEAALRSREIRDVLVRGEIEARSREEDVEANALLASFIDNPTKFAWQSVSAKPEFQTAGVVRALCDAALKERYRRPSFALLLARHAERIASALDRDHYLGVGIHQLKSRSAFACAEAHRALSEIQPALTALDRAAHYARHLADPGFELASIKLERAMILRESERFDEAAILAAEVAEEFVPYGDTLYWISAKNLQGGILYNQKDYAGAAAVWQGLLGAADGLDDGLMGASIRHNIANAYIHLGDAVTAVPLLNFALQVMTALDKPTNAVRIQWSFARVQLLRGNVTEALDRFRSVYLEFERLGMANEALLVQLETAETLMKGARHRDAWKLCKDLPRMFRSRGLTRSAMRSLAFLRQHAVKKTLEVPHVQYVRTFLDRLQRNPQLPFVPPELAA